MSRLLGAAAIAACFVLALGAAQIGRVTEAEARQWATEAAATAKGNVKKFNSEFRKRAEARIRDYDPDGCLPFTFRGDNRGLAVKLYGPVAAFQFSASEMVRQMRPLAGATWFTTAILTIRTTSMIAVRIERAVVKRGEDVIEPTANHIVETKARNLAGAVFDAREGDVWFPLQAFDPAKHTKIQIVLIPEVGKNLAATLGGYDLSIIRESPLPR